MFSPLPPGPFATILADPPWNTITYSRKRSVPSRGKADPYKTITLADLQTLPVASVAAKDCVLIMWILDSHIDQGIKLAEEWGFKFKTKALVWRKLTNDLSRTKMGMGKWTRKETEIAFLFSRGKPHRLSGGVREIIDAPRREHSRKPDEQYERIEALVAGPYLELFSRTTAPGWTAWGNEVGKFDDGLSAEERELIG